MSTYISMVIPTMNFQNGQGPLKSGIVKLIHLIIFPWNIFMTWIWTSSIYESEILFIEGFKRMRKILIKKCIRDITLNEVFNYTDKLNMVYTFITWPHMREMTGFTVLAKSYSIHYDFWLLTIVATEIHFLRIKA